MYSKFGLEFNFIPPADHVRRGIFSLAKKL